jgi:hypothetical protein
MLNLRRITLVVAVAIMFGLAALVKAVPPAPDVVIGTDPSAMCSLNASALTISTAAFGTLEGVVRSSRRKLVMGEHCLMAAVKDVAHER